MSIFGLYIYDDLTQSPENRINFLFFFFSSHFSCPKPFVCVCTCLMECTLKSHLKLYIFWWRNCICWHGKCMDITCHNMVIKWSTGHEQFSVHTAIQVRHFHKIDEYIFFCSVLPCMLFDNWPSTIMLETFSSILTGPFLDKVWIKCKKWNCCIVHWNRRYHRQKSSWNKLWNSFGKDIVDE